MRCLSTDPLQWPKFDDHDHDKEDRKLTVTCLAPEQAGEMGK